MPVNRIALLIGMNYKQTPYELKGCINDVTNTARVLRERYDFHPDNIHMLLDTDPKRYPTPENIFREFEAALAQTDGDSVFYFHFSGHGFSLHSNNSGVLTAGGGKIAPGLAECVLCRGNGLDKDINHNNTICTDQFNKMLELVPQNMLFFGVIDACDSGQVFELSHNVRSINDTTTKIKQYTLSNTPNAQCYLGNVILLSSVKTRKVAWDSVDRRGRPSGAFTACLIELLDKKTTLSYLDMLHALQIDLDIGKQRQDPSLAFCRLDLIGKRFLCK